MPYLPKSKYKVSQTSGREFMYAITQKEYTGPYIVTSDGMLFAGNNINKVKQGDILVPLKTPKKDNTYIVMEPSKIGQSTEYFNLLRPTLFKNQDKFEPLITTKPPPTEKDYLNGYFYRYIVKRRNSNHLYYEVSKETYESLKNKDGKYDHHLHSWKKIKWDLSDNALKNNNSTLRKVVNNTIFEKIRDFFPDLEEYKLTNEVLNPQITPTNINSPKPKLPLGKRKSVIKAQKGAIDLIKEKSRKKYNKSSGGTGNMSSPTFTPSGGGGGGY